MRAYLVSFAIVLVSLVACSGSSTNTPPGSAGQPCNPSAAGTDGCDATSVCVAEQGTCRPDCAQVNCINNGTCSPYFSQHQGQSYSVCFPPGVSPPSTGGSGGGGGGGGGGVTAGSSSGGGTSANGCPAGYPVACPANLCCPSQFPVCGGGCGYPCCASGAGGGSTSSSSSSSSSGGTTSCHSLTNCVKMNYNRQPTDCTAGVQYQVVNNCGQPAYCRVCAVTSSGSVDDNECQAFTVNGSNTGQSFCGSQYVSIDYACGWTTDPTSCVRTF